MGDDVNDLPAMADCRSFSRSANAAARRVEAGEFCRKSAWRQRRCSRTGRCACWRRGALRHRRYSRGSKRRRILASLPDSIDLTPMKLSDYVVRFLAEQGVKHVFLVTGGGAMHLNHSLGMETRIQAVCNSHEQASAICAEGYAKATNHLGVCMVTTGPGGTNAVTGVAGAWLDSTPTLFISGQVKRPDRMFDETGGPGYAAIGRAGSGHRFHRQAAYQVCRDGSGSQRDSLPLGEGRVSGTPWTSWTGLDRYPAGCSGFTDRRSIASARLSIRPNWRKCELFTFAVGSYATDWKLNQAQRPLLFAGNGIRLARAEEEFEQLRRLLSDSNCSDMVCSRFGSEQRSVVRGSTWIRGGSWSKFRSAELRLSARYRCATGFRHHRICSRRIWLVGPIRQSLDIDEAELKKLHPYLQQPICADAKCFLAGDSCVKGIDSSFRSFRLGCPLRRLEDTLPGRDEEHRKPEGPVSVFNLAEVIGTEVSPQDRLVVGNSGSAIEIYLLAFPTLHSQRLFHTAGSRSDGLRHSDGDCSCNGEPGREVIAVDGDGGFMFNIQELETIRRLQLPIKFFVLNNDGYASIRASQKAYFGESKLGADKSNGVTIPSLTRVGEAFGLSSHRD